MSDLAIRKASANDVRAINDIRNYYVEETIKNLSYTMRSMEDALQWFWSVQENYPILVATLDNEVVGVANLSSFRNFDGYCKTAESSIYLHREYVGKGIGDRLYGRLIEEAKLYGFHCLVAVVTAGNESSVSLHTKAGFAIQGVLHEVGFKKDCYLDVIMMTRIL